MGSQGKNPKHFPHSLMATDAAQSTDSMIPRSFERHGSAEPQLILNKSVPLIF